MPLTNVTSKWVDGALVFSDTAGTELMKLNTGSVLVSDGAVVQNAVVTATLAEVNAGKTLITGITGKSIKVIDYTMVFSGAFQTATSIELEDSNGTPVVVTSLAIAGATDGAVITPAHTNISNGAGFLAAVTAGANIVVTKTGSDATNGTSVAISITYTIS